MATRFTLVFDDVDSTMDSGCCHDILQEVINHGGVVKVFKAEGEADLSAPPDWPKTFENDLLEVHNPEDMKPEGPC